MSALIGSPAVLRCDAIGLPKPHVTWSRGGEEMSETSAVQFPSAGLLQFLSVGVGDGGVYECTASNEAGGVSRNVTLSVLGQCARLQLG